MNDYVYCNMCDIYYHKGRKLGCPVCFIRSKNLGQAIRAFEKNLQKKAPSDTGIVKATVDAQFAPVIKQTRR